jgi:hypothetical protein
MDLVNYVQSQRAHLRIVQQRYDYELDRLEKQYPGLYRFYKNKYYVRTVRDTIVAQKFLRSLPPNLQQEYVDAAAYLFRLVLS